MFCNLERFVFCAHTRDFKLLLLKFEINFENDELRQQHFGIEQQEFNNI